jgi:hypothetical protein
VLEIDAVGSEAAAEVKDLGARLEVGGLCEMSDKPDLRFSSIRP